MPITFQGLDDPFNLRSASGALAQALMQRNVMDRQERSLLGQETRAEERAIGGEKRAVQMQIDAEKRAKETRQSFGGALKEAMAIVSDPNTSTLQKVGALQEYATLSGDQKGVSPILSQILKDSSRQEESKSALDFLRSQGINIPETGGAIPPVSFLGSYAQGLAPTFEPESEKLEARRVVDVADRIVQDYEGAEASKNRLAQMEVAAKSGVLPSPAMMKTMDKFGIPLSVFANPASEAYEKNVNEYIKDVSKYFPGQIRVSEIEYYMKAIPTLMNSDEGKLLIIENQQLLNSQKEAAYEAYKEILKENKGKKPRNLDVEILERTRPFRNEVATKLIDNFEKGVSMTKFPTKKVTAGTKLTVDQARNYWERSGGDRAKAEQMARSDGYEF